MADRIRDCLLEKVKQGRLSDAQARTALAEIEELELDFANAMAKSPAERLAVERTVQRMAKEAAERKRRRAYQLLAAKAAMDDVTSHPKGPAAGAMAVLSFDRWGLARRGNVETRASSLLGLFQARFRDGMAAYAPRLLRLVQDKDGLERLVRELFGEGTGDAVAAAAAKSWSDTAELARKLGNQAGASIGELKNWRLPQAHNRERIARAGFGAWLDFVLPKLDREAMRSATTGKVMAEQALTKALRLVYDEIATGGLSRLDPENLKGGNRPALATQMARHRYLHFRDADGWLAYHRTFGSPDTYGVLMGHLREMATKVAMMQRLGPNPETTVRLLEDLVAKGEIEAAARGGSAVAKGATWWRFAYPIRSTYLKLTGELDGTAHEIVPGASRFMQGVRNYLTGSQLGSAFINGFLTDPLTVKAAAKMNGLPMARAIGDYLRLFKPGSAEDRALADRLAIVNEDALSFAFGANRYQDEAMGRGFSSFVADLPLRVSGLTRHTESWRRGYAMTWLGELGEHARAGRTFDQLPEPMRETFERYRLAAEDWEKVKAAPLFEAPGGRAFVDPVAIAGSEAAGGSTLALRFMDMVTQERDRAVIGSSAQTFAILMLGSEGRRGTPVGEVGRSFAMYKQFGVSLLLRHMAAVPGRRILAARYVAKMFLSLTLGGALAVQLREIANGRDPRDMDDPSFWLAAMAAGGGLTIFGDFAYSLFRSGESRAGAGPITTIFGPVAGLGENLIAFAASNAGEAAARRDTNVGREALRLARASTPGGNIWYLRLAFGRLVFDELQKAVDPDAARSFRRMEQRAEQEFGQAYWWRPGQRSPDRAPTLTDPRR